MPVATSGQRVFGFTLNSKPGSTVWLPMIEREGVESGLCLRKMYRLHGQTVRSHNVRYFLGHERVDGEVAVPIIPGSVSNLLSWIQARDANNQGACADCIEDRVNQVVKASDVKVAKATFEFRHGRAVFVILEVSGPNIAPGKVLQSNVPTLAPYVFNEVEFKLAHHGQSLENETGIAYLRVVIDNNIAEGDLRNVGNIRAYGHFTREITDDTVLSDFAAGVETAATIAMSRGAATCLLTLPRILYTDHVVLSQGGVLFERVSFFAFASVDGITPPISLI
jgi:hypothetical protein